MFILESSIFSVALVFIALSSAIAASHESRKKSYNSIAIQALSCSGREKS